MIIEVFKTNVKDPAAASILLEYIHNHFSCYKANFDLDDRDRILRVASFDGPIQNDQLIYILMNMGFYAEVLPDELPFVQSTCSHQNLVNEYK